MPQLPPCCSPSESWGPFQDDIFWGGHAGIRTKMSNNILLIHNAAFSEATKNLICGDVVHDPGVGGSDHLDSLPCRRVRDQAAHSRQGRDDLDDEGYDDYCSAMM